MSVSKLVNVKALFFDMDNTIINTREGDEKVCDKLNYFLNERHDVDMKTAARITSAFLHSLRVLRPRPTGDETIDEWRLSLWKEALGPSFSHLSGCATVRGVMTLLNGWASEELGPLLKNMNEQKEDELYAEWLRIRYRYVKASPEVKSFLTELRSIYRLVLITNGHTQPQWEKIHACGLEPYFDCIRVSGDTCWRKPNAELFLSACEELNMKPEQCAIVGDRVETDIRGGKNAHFAATFWINYDSAYQTSPTSAEDSPDFVINDVLELKQIFAQLTTDNWSNIS